MVVMSSVGVLCVDCLLRGGGMILRRIGSASGVKGGGRRFQGSAIRVAVYGRQAVGAIAARYCDRSHDWVS